MKLGIRLLLRWRPVWGLALILLILGGIRLYAIATAGTRIDPALKQAMIQTSSFPRLIVRLDFTPEDFHIKYLQQFGMIGGVQGSRVVLLNVKSVDISRLGEIYWIRRVELPESSP